MSDERTTKVSVEVEYVPTPVYVRITKVVVMVEYYTPIPPPTNVGIMGNLF